MTSIRFMMIFSPVLTEYSESLANVNSRRQKHNVPGWNAHVREVHAAARDAYLLWKIGGRPRQGVLCDLMRNSRLRFKHTLRMCTNNKNAIIADKIADNLCNKDDRTFWREIKNVTNSKVNLPGRIGDVHGSNAVAGMWKEHYSSIFNAVSGSNCTELHKQLCDAHYVFDRSMSVSPSEITEIINALQCNKSPGLDGLTSEHLKYAVAGMWKEHYSSIFNAVSGSNCTELHKQLCDAHYVFDRSMSVSPSEITEIINALQCNKSPGLDGLTSEHLKYASSELSVLLSILMSSILVHGRVPSAILKSVMIPIVKNKNKHITDKENYRPICLANVFTKVIENVLLVVSRIGFRLHAVSLVLKQSTARKCVFSF